jgi:RNA polymerase sigma factor (sigma-70 family)
MKPEMVLGKDTEGDIIASVRAGDRNVLQHLYKQCYSSILHMIQNNNGSEDEAKDVFQEAFIIFYEKALLPDFELKCAVATYIYSVSRRLWLKKLMEKNRFSGIVAEDHDFVSIEDEFPEMVAKEKRLELMKSGLEELGEPCSTILKDFYIEKMSMDGITEKFGYTNPDNAKNQKYKCLQRLKKYFFTHYKGEE